MLGFGLPGDDDQDDDDLEAELAALEGRPLKQKKKDKNQGPTVTMGQIEAMAAEGLRDVDEDDMSDGDLEDDDDLLSELADITGSESPTCTVKPTPTPRNRSASATVKTIEEREGMYERAIEQAKAKGEGSKQRRFNRLLKSVQEMLKAAQKGQSVNLEELPPPIGVVPAGGPSSVDTRPSPSLPPVPAKRETKRVFEQVPKSQTPPTPAKRPMTKSVVSPETVVEERKAVYEKVLETANASDDSSSARHIQLQANSRQEQKPKDSVDHGGVSSKDSIILSVVKERQVQYKQAALRAKSGGDTKTALSYMKIGKILESMAQSLQTKPADFDVESLPPTPPGFSDSESAKMLIPHMAQAPPPASAPVIGQQQQEEEENVIDESIPVPKTVLEALQQRLAKYETAVAAAKEEGQGSKARRMGRIVKQYQEAIRACKAKKPFNFRELPAPPGYPPIPGGTSKPGVNVVTSQPKELNVDEESLARSSVGLQAQSQRPTAVHSFPAPPSASDQQLQILLKRQTELKKAALRARDDDRDRALEYLRSAKSMDQMIEAARSGIKVDMSQIPTLNETRAHADPASSTKTRSPQDEDVFERLETRLRAQLDIANRMAEHCDRLGNIQETAQFRKLSNACQHDLDAVSNARSYWLPVPKFHYEERSFPLIRSCPELSDSEAEVVVVRGINLPQPDGYAAKDLDTYVIVEFPYPTESPPKSTGSAVKGTANPDYSQAFKFKIDRKQRALARSFKRRPVKVEIWYDRGFLHRDRQLGEASIKIENLESKCEIHASVDVVDNRKPTRGKLELKVRLREPLQGQEVEVVEEKWLVVDHAKQVSDVHTLTSLESLKVPTAGKYSRSLSPRRGSSPVAQPSPAEQSPLGPPVESIVSYQVLKMAEQSAEQSIAKFKAQGQTPPTSLVHRAAQCKQKYTAIQKNMKQGGKAYLQGYIRQLEAKVAEEDALMTSSMRSGNKEEAKSALMRKKRMEGEIGTFKSKYSL